MKFAGIRRLTAQYAILLLVLLGLAGNSAAAPESSEARIVAAKQLNVAPAQVITAAQMKAAADLGAAAPSPPPRPQPFLSRLDQPTYNGLKAKAALNPGRPASEAGRAAALQPPVGIMANFAGVTKSVARYYPPDTHGAAGLDYFAEVTNTHLDIYQKAAPYTLVKSISTEQWLGAQRGYFDHPRLIYDPVYNRWVFLVTQWRTPRTKNYQYLYLAVSQTSDPTGNYYLYKIDVSDYSVSKKTQWDYPQLGQDSNSIIITGDFFNLYGNRYVDSRMFSIAKSVLYSGLPFIAPLFTGLDGTIAPPIVLDDNPYSFLVTADVYTNRNYVTLYALLGSGTSTPVLYTHYIQVPNFWFPPYAIQTGTNRMLDTLDCRFVNASTQIGDSLFQVHTVAYSGLATPRFYEFDTVNNIVIQSGMFYGSNSSNDFNASIAANQFKDVFVTWSSTDRPNRINAQVRVSGRLHTDPPGVISNGVPLFTSTAYLTGNPTSGKPIIQRWGNYCAVSPDPADLTGATAWVVNENIYRSNLWGSRIGQITLP